MVDDGHKSRDAADADGVETGREDSEVRLRGPLLFGDYELLTRLRAGGMAEVFSARRRVHDPGTLAIKRLLPALNDEAEFIAMFLDETRLAQRFDHPNIPRAIEVGRVDDTPYIAMELVEGPDLAWLLRVGREHAVPMPLTAACRVAREAASALAYAHALTDAEGQPLAIVHRDVSPHNLVISAAGEVKLIDFGVAKSESQTLRTGAGVFKGKHGYLSPEQAGGGPVDFRSDLFSLGICLYEMLAGRRLFKGSSDFSTLQRVRRADVPPLLEVEHWPADVSALLARLLARDPADRAATTEEVVEALSAIGDAADGQADLRAYVAELRALSPLEEVSAAPPVGDTGTGLSAFFDLEPVSSVSVLGGTAPVSTSPQDPVTDEAPRAAHGPGPEFGDRPRAAAPTESSTGAQLADAAVQVRQAQTVSDDELRVADPSVPPNAVAPDLNMDWDDEDEVNTDEYDTPHPVALHTASPAPLPPLPLSPLPEDIGPALPAASELPEASPPPLFSTPPRPDATDHAPHVSVLELADPPGAAVSRAVPGPLARAQGLFARRYTPVGVAIVALTIVALTIGGGLLAGGLVGTAAPATVHLATSPVDAVVRVDGRLAPGSHSPFVIGGLDPERVHVIEVSKPGYTSWGTRLQVAEAGQVIELPQVVLRRKPEATARPPAVPAESAEPAGSGPQASVASGRNSSPETAVPRPRLAVTEAEGSRESAAGAGRPLNQAAAQGAAPTRLGGAMLASGIPAAGSPVPAPKSAQAAAPGAKTATALPHPVGALATGDALTGKPGPRLRINSRPWSQVFIDGAPVGNTPLLDLPLSPGRHRVRLSNPKFGLSRTLVLTMPAEGLVTRVVELR